MKIRFIFGSNSRFATVGYRHALWIQQFHRRISDMQLSTGIFILRTTKSVPNVTETRFISVHAPLQPTVMYSLNALHNLAAEIREL